MMVYTLKIPLQLKKKSIAACTNENVSECNRFYILYITQSIRREEWIITVCNHIA